MPETVTLRDNSGRAYGVPQEQVASYIAQGFRPESDQEAIDRTAAETFHEEHGGVGGAIGASVAGGLSGLTLGLSDQALAGLGADRTLRHLEAEHPYAAGGGQVLGALAPTILTGGAAAGEEAAGLGARILAHSPAGLASKVGGAIGELGEGAGLAGRTLASTGGAAAEGALYGGGQYLTETALEDKPLSAEGFVAGMGHGALFAAPIGGVGTLASATLQRAASLFPRSEVSAAAAAGVKEQASGALAQTVRDGDAMVQAAERKLSDIDAGIGMAQTGEGATRRVFGAADPQAIADQVTGATARQEVSQALEGYQQARQQFEDWVATEADPAFAAAFGKLDENRPMLDRMLARADQGDLDELLGTMRGGSRDEKLQAAMRRTLDGPDVLGAGGIPIGEFGAPGAGGFKGQDTLARLAAGTGREEGEQVAALAPEDVTGAGGPRALRAQGTPVGGVPAQEIVQRGMADEGTVAGKRAAAPLEPPATAVGKRPAMESIAPPSSPARPVSDEAYDAMKADLRSKMTRAEKEAALYYTGLGSNQFNKQLSAGMIDAEHVGTITDLDSLLNKGAQDHPVLLHRGLRGRGIDEIVASLKPGDRIIEGGFGSATAESDIAKSYGNVQMEIEVPSGYPIGAIPTASGFEFEILLRRNTEYQIVDKSTAGDRITLRARVVPTEAPPAPSPLARGDKAPAVPRIQRVSSVDPAPNLGLPDRALIAGRYGKGAAPLPEGEVPEHGALSKYLDRTGRDYADQTLPAREIADRGYFEPPGGGADAVRVENARKAIAEGQQTPVKLTVSPEGKILVTDGRHRLAAAIEADAPIKVRWTTGTEPAESDVFRAGARAAAEPVADDLLAALSGTHAALDRGESFTAVGRAPAAATRAEQKARAATAAEHFRNEALAKRPFEGPVNLPHSFDRAARAITGKSADDLAAELRGAPTGIPDRARVAGRYGAPGTEVDAAARAADPLAAFGLESDPTRLGAAGGDVPAEVRALALPDRTAVDTGIKARMGAVRDERAIAKAIMRHNGKNADMGPRIAREAKVIGDLEAANARLADALGSEAPPTAVTSAKAFHEATAKAQQRAAASSAKLGADLQNKVPAMTGGTDATVVDDDVAKALRKHESRAAARAEKTTVSPAPEMPAEFPAAPTPTETPAAAAAPPTGGLGSKAADVGSALEVMRAIGMHVPAVSHIPVIGPILGLWLKARAVMGIIGRKGGSIGKSTEGLIASKSAAVQDRIVKATGALLEVGARAAKQASHLAGPAVLLSGSLFPGGEKPAIDKPRDLFEARSSEITRAMQPGAVDQAIAQRFPTSDPAMHDAIVAQVQRGIAFLDTKRPKQTVLPGVLPGDGTWAPSAAAIEEFGKYVHAVNDPVSVLEDLAKGHPSAEGAETLRAVYPQLYQYAQKQLLAAAPEMARTLPYPRRVMLSILYQIPVDGTMQPSHAQYLQIPAAPSPSPKAPATTGPLRLGQQTLSPLDQRASGA